MNSYIDIFNLEGKVAVITGGATGLGFSMAQCLAGANATVVLIGRREEELEHACREIGERAHYIRCDITDFPHWWSPLCTGLDGWMSLLTMQEYR